MRNKELHRSVFFFTNDTSLLNYLPIKHKIIYQQENIQQLAGKLQIFTICQTFRLRMPMSSGWQENYMPSMDPMIPPIVRLLRASYAINRRYLLARVQEPSLIKALRLPLACMTNPPVCVLKLILKPVSNQRQHKRDFLVTWTLFISYINASTDVSVRPLHNYTKECGI